MPTSAPDRIPGPPTPAARRHLWAVLLLVAVTAGLYAPSLRYPLLFDDADFVTENPYIGSLRNIDAFFNPAYWRVHRLDRSYRPLVEGSITANWVLSGGRAEALRAVNIALLAAVGALVYGLAWRLTRSPAAAVVAGLFFAAHPMHLETVAMIKNRAELQAGLFGLLALWWFLNAAEGRRRWWGWWLASVAASAGALLSKEVALALPAVLTAAALALRPGGGRARGLLLAVPAWLLAAGFLALLFGAMPERYAQRPPLDRPLFLDFAALGLGQRALVVIKTAGVYLGLLVWPFMVCADRGFEIPQRLGEPAVAASLAVVVLVAGLAMWMWRRRHPVAVFSLVWLGLALAPVANLSPVATRPIAEQRLLAATVPLALLAGIALSRLGAVWFVAGRGKAERGGRVPFRVASNPPAQRHLAADLGRRSDVSASPSEGRPGRDPADRPTSVSRLAATVFVAAWVAAMAVTTRSALRPWASELAFWERAARQSPGVWRTQYNYGTALLKNEDLPWRERHAAAIPWLERAMRLDDLQANALQNLARCLWALGRLEESGRLARLALAWDRNAAVGHMVLARVLRDGGHTEAALYELRQARDCEPGDPRYGLALASALEQAGRFREALDECRRLVTEWPGHWVAREAQAIAKRAGGRS